MKKQTTVAMLCALAGCGVLVAGFGAMSGGSPGIEGSYMLDYRELPDGRKVRFPNVGGMLTFTRGYRNFNVFWVENGKKTTISAVSKYSLTEKEFSEENMYYMMVDGIGGGQITFETASTSGKSPVTTKGDQVSFKLPLHGEPEVVFDKTGLVATRAGAFVDHWKRVD